MKNTMHGMKRCAACFLSLALGAAALSGCGGEAQTEEVVDLTISVEAEKPFSGDLVLSNEFMGTVSPEDTVYVYPKAQGEVVTVNFEEGDYVNAGDVLFTIDDEAAQISLAQAKIGQASAQAQASAAQIGIANAELNERNTIDQMNNAKVLQLVGQEGTMENLDTQIKNAELSIKQIEINMNNLEDSRSTLKGQRNSLENQIDELDHAIDDMTDSDARGQLINQKAALVSARDTVKDAQESLDDQIEGLSMQLQQAKNSLALAKESKKTTQDTNLVTNVETDRKIGTTTEQLELGKQSAQAQAQAAQVGVENAKVSIEQAELALSYYTVKAPISGVIKTKNVELHNNASASQAAYTIISQNAMTVEFNVSEDVKNTLSIGDVLKVDRNGREYEARITEISESVGDSTGLFKIKGAVTENASELAAGVAVKVTAETYSAMGVLLIPYGSVYYEDGAPYVYLAKNGKAVKTFIQTGIFDDQNIAVTSGLSPEDVVITTWSPQLMDGVAVKVASDKKEESKENKEESVTGTGKETEAEAAE